MKYEYEIPATMHHSVVEASEVEHARLVYNELMQAQNGQHPLHPWGHMLSSEEMGKRAAHTIQSLVQIITRLTADTKPCPRCSGQGSVIERMGGCRDDNESVVCPECHGRFPKPEPSHADSPPKHH